MTTRKNCTKTGLTVVVVAIGLVPTAILGLFIYASATAPVLHPNAQDVASIANATPVPRWTGAVEQARQAVRAALAEHNLPGVSVAVGASGEASGEIVWAEGFGWANLEKKVPVSPETRFRIGTASPVLTSAAVGLLLEKERLKLDEAIQAYVPEFTQRQWPATLRQVMGHVAGVRSDGGDEGPLFGEQCNRPADALPHFGHEQRFEPGTQYQFSNFGWILVSAAVESVADEPFLSFMRKQIFEPLGMDHTEADFEAGPGPERTTDYFPKFAGDPRYGPDVMRPLNLSCYAGAGAFLSTPSDLVRFGLAINSGKLLQPATVQLLQTSLRLPSGEDTGYGLGWDLESVELSGKPTRVAGHDGNVLGGMAMSFLTFPEHNLVVAVTSNTSYADTHALGITIAQAFAGHARN
ncbi:MAG: serine hydrolase domain-containing protein [Acidobacteriota bacterium]|nr:serine hydrolase domain-containing protein [Acidobacteriota bacterium]